MSNYNWSHPDGFADRVNVGAEVINGTGSVKIVITAGEDEYTGLDVEADEALRIGGCILDQAWQAKRAKYDADRTGATSAQRHDRTLKDAQARLTRVRAAAETPQNAGGVPQKLLLEILGDEGQRPFQDCAVLADCRGKQWKYGAAADVWCLVDDQLGPGSVSPRSARSYDALMREFGPLTSVGNL